MYLKPDSTDKSGLKRKGLRFNNVLINSVHVVIIDLTFNKVDLYKQAYQSFSCFATLMELGRQWDIKCAARGKGDRCSPPVTAIISKRISGGAGRAVPNEQKRQLEMLIITTVLLLFIKSFDACSTQFNMEGIEKYNTITKSY